MSYDRPANKTTPRPPVPSGPLLKQIAGMPEARAYAEGLVQDIELFKSGRLAWPEIDSGCVFYGPPGTGKTTLVRAIAATAKLPLVASSYADWCQNARFGVDIMANMAKAFKTAEEHAPCILGIDELDSMPARAGLSPEHNSTYAIVNALLVHLDNLSRRTGVVVIGTCNHPNNLDPALVRSGRLGRNILIRRPAVRDLPAIIAFHLGPSASTIGNLPPIAILCAGMTGADIEQVVREARQHARRAGRPLQRRDLVDVLESKCKSRDPKTQWRIALHEAGHALAAYRRLKSSDVTLSILANENSEGRALYNLHGQPLTRRLVEEQLVVLLAGRAAEQTILGDVSAYAGGDDGSDLAKATRLALDAVGCFGLSTSDRLIWYGSSDRKTALHYSGALVVEADEMLREAYCEAVALIEHERAFVERVAKALVKQRALSHEDFVALEHEPFDLASLMPLPIFKAASTRPSAWNDPAPRPLRAGLR